jgi:glutamate N-acetyltransferase/amino-acid N-acetyltransferase
MRVYKKAVLPLGFQANAIASGIRRSGKLDLALFYSSTPAKAACLFTANSIKAAPLRLSIEHLKKGNFFRAIIANSGNANSFTGRQGLRDVALTAYSLARELAIKKEEVLVTSTGIIGRRLPIEKITAGIPKLVSGLSCLGVAKAARAILTTDNFSKEVTVKFAVGNKTVTISGVAKGAGMIAPQMATLLCFIFTDAYIAKDALKRALRQCVESSFNSITVDGCMSTNDCVMMLANGAAGNKLIKQGKNFELFLSALKMLCLNLAKMLIHDAEGATKFIQITVSKARDFKEARLVALNIAISNLLKTAIYGENPNFGRIVSAVGATGIAVREEDLKIKVSPLNKKEVFVKVALNRGMAQATIYTSDLSPEYVRINAAYN